MFFLPLVRCSAIVLILVLCSFSRFLCRSGEGMGVGLAVPVFSSRDPNPPASLNFVSRLDVPTSACLIVMPCSQMAESFSIPLCFLVSFS